MLILTTAGATMARLGITALLILMLNYFASAQLVLDKKSHDFEVLSNWSESPALFPFVNTYKEDVAILNIKASPEVKIAFPKGYIKPGQRDTFFIYYEALELGPFDEKIEIYHSASMKPVTLRIKGQVNSFIECPTANYDPASLVFEKSGVVTDALTGKPIPNQKINVITSQNEKMKLKTNKKGTFKEKFKIGQYIFLVDAPGYQLMNKSIYINKNTPEMVFELMPVNGEYALEEEKDEYDIEPETEDEKTQDPLPVKPEKEKKERDTPEKEKPDTKPGPEKKQSKPDKEAIQPETNTPIITKAENFRMKGIVVDQNGQPVKKAVVSMTHMDDLTPYIYKTLSHGTFHWMIKPGAYRIEVNAPGYKSYFREKALGPDDVPLRIELETEKPEQEILTEKEPVEELEQPVQDKHYYQEGVVFDAGSGSPVGRATVKFIHQESQIPYYYKTLKDGKFKKELKPGKYRLEVYAPGYQKLSTDIVLQRGNPELKIKLNPDDTEIIVQDNEPPVPDKNLNLSGQVVDENTLAAVPRASIKFYQLDEKIPYRYKTLKNGKFSQNLKPGKYEITVTAPGYQDFYKVVNIKSPDPDFDIKMTPSVIIVEEDPVEVTEEITKEKNQPEKESPDPQVEPSIPEKDFDEKGYLSRNKYAANNIVFLIDISSSMKSRHKLENLQNAMGRLTQVLREIDNITLITYSTEPSVLLSSVPANEKDTIQRTIDSLKAYGFTYGIRGLEKAYDIAKDAFIEGGNNQVIIATDGEFNSPDFTEIQMVRLITNNAQEGVILTVMGFGNNNKAIRKMRRMAAFGKGNFIHITNKDDAEAILIEEVMLNSKIE